MSEGGSEAAVGARSAPLITKTPIYRAARLSTGIFLRTWNRLRVLGAEHVPAAGGALIVANHASYLDIPAMANATRRHVCFVARASLSRSRLINLLLVHTGAVLIEPGRPDRQALRDMVEHLRAGDCVTIFPEGTRSLDGRVGEFRGGVLLAARQTGVPILPAGISGSWAAYRRGHLFPRPARMTVRFGRPIDPADPRALELAHAAVRELVDEPPPR